MVSLAAVDSFKTYTIMGWVGWNLTEEAQSILSKAYEEKEKQKLTHTETSGGGIPEGGGTFVN